MSQRVDCSEFLERLDAWIDGDLNAGEASRMEAHIAGCPGCREERRFAEEIRAELRRMPELDPPERVLAGVRKAAGPPARERLGDVLGWLVLRPLPAMAALAVLLLAIVLWGQRSRPRYTDREIRQATAETRLALAYISDAARRAEREVRKKALEEREFPAAMRGISRTLLEVGGGGTVQPTVPASPTNTSKGS